MSKNISPISISRSIILIILLSLIDHTVFCAPLYNHVDKLNIKTSYGYYDKIEYSTTERKVSTDLIINNVGEFVITYFTRNGKTMSWPSRFIEAPFQSYLDENGEIKKPVEKFEGTNIELGYGLKINVFNSDITLAAGYRDYDGETPNKSSGDNSKFFDISAFKAFSIIENNRFRLRVNYFNYKGEYLSGNSIYMSTRGGHLNDYKVKLTAPTPIETIKLLTSLHIENVRQNLFFDFYDLPQLMPNTKEECNKYTIKQGTILNEKIKIGLATTFGSTLVSLIDADIESGLPSSGMFIGYVNQKNIKIDFSYNQLKGEKIGTFFSDSDLFQYIKEYEIILNLEISKFSFDLTYTNIYKKTQFLKEGPLDIFLVTFPENDRICEWDENIIEINAVYNFNKYGLGLNFIKSIASYNQYGLKNDIDQQDYLSLFIEFKF